MREAGAADTNGIVALLQQINLGPAGVLTPGSRYWIAEESGRIIGVVGLEYGPEAVLLRSAGVLPEQRGKHIGTHLVELALANARADGIQHVYLFSTGAGAYWQRHGFVEVAVDEVVAALPDAFQVRHYAELGWLPDEVAWRKTLA